MEQADPVAKITAHVRRGQDLGRSIGNFRRLTGKTQASLAEETGLTRSRIAQVEAGLTTPLLETELRLLRHLGATITIEWDPRV